MSKNLSLKLRDDVFSDTEDVIESIHKTRNAYINDALSFYNKFIRRKLLAKQLKKESRLVAASSLKVLEELELIEDGLSE